MQLDTGLEHGPPAHGGHTFCCDSAQLWQCSGLTGAQLSSCCLHDGQHLVCCRTSGAASARGATLAMGSSAWRRWCPQQTGAWTATGSATGRPSAPTCTSTVSAHRATDGCRPVLRGVGAVLMLRGSILQIRPWVCSTCNRPERSTTSPTCRRRRRVLQRGRSWPRSSSWGPRSRWGAAVAGGHALCPSQESAVLLASSSAPQWALPPPLCEVHTTVGSGPIGERLTATKLGLACASGMGHTSAL